MEGIIEFLFGNLFFLLLILGALFNFFIRAGKKEEPPPKKRPQRAEEEIDWREIFRQEQAQTEQERKQSAPPVRMEKIPHVGDSSVDISVPTVHEYSTEIERKRQELAQKRKQLENRPIDVSEQSPIFTNEIGKRRSALQMEFNQLTNEDAKRGVIWAEVLGKPRAKRPHETFYKGKKKQG